MLKLVADHDPIAILNQENQQLQYLRLDRHDMALSSKLDQGTVALAQRRAYIGNDSVALRGFAMRRRTLLAWLSAAPAALLVRGLRAAPPSVEELQARWRELLPARLDVPSPAEKLSLSDEEWRRRLEPMQYAVLREEETERAFTSALNNNQEAGVYLCVGCGLPLFSSEMKFDSGTGWPSFFTTIPDAFETKLDFVLFLPRTEYHCARCGGHHGHIFKDGPPPTYERWCNNGVALEFVAAKG